MTTTSYQTDAFLLLSLSNCILVTDTTHQSGTLLLECVTIEVPDAPNTAPHVYLVLRLNELEIPIDPTRVIRTTLSDSGSRTYTFLASEVDPVEMVLTVSIAKVPDPHFLEDVEIFESILAQYADLQGVFPQVMANPNIYDKTDSEELRGHLVLVDQDNGEVVGEFDRKFLVQEDPMLSKKGHEADPVVIELNDGDYDDANAMEMFARAIPPDQQDWITKGATIISHAIAGSTTLLLTAISAGSSYYTNNSKAAAPSSSSSFSSSSVSSGTPPPPPQAVSFLSSARTRKGLAAVQSVSGEAVKVSAKTVQIIDKMIKLAVGSSKGKGRATLAPPLPPRASSPSSLEPPPPYTKSSGSFQSEKPPLPPRRQTSTTLTATISAAPPLPPRTNSGSPMPSTSGQEQAATKLSSTARILLSADLILSTIDVSTRRLLDSGTSNLGTVVGHKYGKEAGESSVMLAGTARNVALVYIDLRGIGRRALLRRTGKEFVKGRVSDHIARKSA
ncbi:hypothetical protein B0H15DRAFT_930516 [Mycena belliarum]|uniref:Senescence domain-containing protein n=1 Tax=Mycena belliarum TaxID=1033014 RepID=A0AAD6U5Z3_9AGAR|nr:hypothetical protein B0H15DRAFT_930516 [Mycena belliae]